MKDETKTQKQLIAELEEMRRRNAESEAKKVAMQRIQEEIWKMESAEDFRCVLTCVGECLGILGISYRNCGINVVGTDPPTVLSRSTAPEGGWIPFDPLEFEDGKAQKVIQFWQSGEPVYRRDLELEDPYDERKYLQTLAPIRSVLDIPFSHGTLAINNTEPNAFSDEDIAVVQELAEAISLGYARYLDFQRLEEQAEQARRERAVERVRAEAMAMRSRDDLLQVVIILHQEMEQLGVQSHSCSIAFIDEGNNRLHNYYTSIYPLFMVMSDFEDFDGSRAVQISETVLDDKANEPLVSAWREKRVDTQVQFTSVGSWSHRLRELKVDLSKHFSQTSDEERHVTNVPFEYGAIGFVESTFREDSVAIVQELAEALSLGFVRFLDFQQVDEAQRQLIDELEEELQTAHDMQMSLMPTESPQIEGFDISGRCIPANHVGGDFFQYFPEKGKLAVSMADVTGHAMEAAIPVVMFSGILESQIEIESSLEELFNRLNRTLHKTLMDSRTFVCFTMGELNIVNRFFRLSNGGCPYPFHFKAASKEIIELQVDAYPLGVRSDTSYQAIEVQLQTGDYIVFFSDGIIEAANETEEIFGFERTAERIRKGCTEDLTAEALIEQTIAEVKTFSGETPQIDDMTMVVLRVEQEEEIRVEKR